MSDAAGGFYHLPGRADLALLVQQADVGFWAKPKPDKSLQGRWVQSLFSLGLWSSWTGLAAAQVLLPQYGFAGSKEGVQDMIQHCAPFVKDRMERARARERERDRHVGGTRVVVSGGRPVTESEVSR